MASVTTHNLGLVVAQVAPQTAAQNTQNNPSQHTNLSQAQLQQLSKIASEQQLLAGKVQDKNRAPRRSKQVEGSFAAQQQKSNQSENGSGKNKVDREAQSKPHDDGLMDVVA